MADGIQRLLAVMADLRHPEHGCPWDRAQTMQSLVAHTLEEAYEVVDAVEGGMPEAIREELGDLLFQVVFYSHIAQELGWFDFDAVARGVADKLVRRHPHVFGDVHIESAEAQALAWEAHKQREREARSGRQKRRDERRDKEGEAGQLGALADVPLALPALTRAVKLQRRAARQGFDWREAAQVLDKVAEELAELRAELAGSDALRLEHELGDLLLAVSNLARHVGVDPETALRRANQRFEHRFQYMERRLAAQGREMAGCSPEELEALWEEAKCRMGG